MVGISVTGITNANVKQVTFAVINAAAKAIFISADRNFTSSQKITP